MRIVLGVLVVLGVAGCNCAPPVNAEDDAGSCVANVACSTNPGAPCTVGKTSCTNGVSRCIDGASGMAGLTCGTGKVCDGSGACVACTSGMACATNAGSPCRVGTMSCSGQVACLDGTNAANGTSCGSGQVCSEGLCVTCAAGGACTSNPGGACVRGVFSCSSGTQACIDDGNLSAGTLCTNGVCDGTGQCVACAQGMSCATNTNAPCVLGTLTCNLGSPVCNAAGNADAGVSCGNDQVCNGTGACVACAAGQLCTTNPGGACFVGRIACGSGAPSCTDTIAEGAGTSCGTNQVCAGDGGCVACTAGASCTPGTNACIGGTTSCTSGAPVCTATGPVADGTSCTSGACNAGACETNATVTTNVNLSTGSLVGRACADAPSFAVTALDATTATLSTTPASGCLNPGDEVMLINLQGTAGAIDNVGVAEALTVASVAGSTVTFASPKTHAFGADAGSDNSIGTGAGQQHVELVRVPHYGNVVINAGVTVTADPWNGTRGGVVAFRAASLVVNGTISAKALGYRDGRFSSDGTCFASVQTESGESIGGPPAQTTARNFGAPGGFGAASGDSFNADTPINPSAGHSSPGAPGANPHVRAMSAPGIAYGSADGGLLTMGSGSCGNLTCTGGGAGPSLSGAGGNNAGGIVFITASTLTVSATGRILADAQPLGRDGAPSAGSVMLRGDTLSLGTNRVTAAGVQAISGSPPTVNLVNRSSDGYVWLFFKTSLSGTTTPAAFTQQTP